MMRKLVGFGMMVMGGISIACGIKWYNDSMKAIRNLEDNINKDLENALKKVLSIELKSKTPISVDSLCDDAGLEDMVGNCGNQVTIDDLDYFEAHSTPWTEPLA